LHGSKQCINRQLHKYLLRLDCPDRRYIERFNAKLREKAKKDEVKRLKAFVETAFLQDPRMVRRRQAEKAAKWVTLPFDVLPDLIASVSSSASLHFCTSGGMFPRHLYLISCVYGLILHIIFDGLTAPRLLDRDVRKQAKDAAKQKEQQEAVARAAAEAVACAEAEAAASAAAADAKKARQAERKAMQKERSRLRALITGAGAWQVSKSGLHHF
jgi:hypothetical protein